MIKRRGFVLVLLSLALAFGAAWVARTWLQARLAPQASSPDVTVVVAAMEIPFGTVVESRHLKTVQLPRSVPVADHFDKPEDLVGYTALQKAVAGEILLKAHFADHAAGSTLAALLKPDMRAVTVRVDDVIGVGGFLLPGNHVDVVASRMVDNNQRAVSQTVLRNLNVLAVDQTASQDKEQPVVVRAVTLEVTTRQAEVLVKARDEGKIQLTLRNPRDNDATTEEPEVVAAAAPPASPARRAAKSHEAAPKPAGVTIIRGTNIQNTDSAT